MISLAAAFDEIQKIAVSNPGLLLNDAGRFMKSRKSLLRVGKLVKTSGAVDRALNVVGTGLQSAGQGLQNAAVTKPGLLNVVTPQFVLGAGLTGGGIYGANKVGDMWNAYRTGAQYMDAQQQQ